MSGVESASRPQLSPHHSRQSSAAVRFASSSRPHYALARSRSRHPSCTSRVDSESSDDDDDDAAGYETAAESPPQMDSFHSSLVPTMHSRDSRTSSSPARSRTPDSLPGPATPPLACVTSSDILHLIQHDASSPVPFPYRVQWPELPPSPPLTPKLLDTPDSDRPMSGCPPLPTQDKEKSGARWKRSTWSHAPAAIPGTRKLSNVVAWTHPNPTFQFTPSPESERVIPVASMQDAAEVMDGDSGSTDSTKQGRTRTHNEPATTFLTVPTTIPTPLPASTPARVPVPSEPPKDSAVPPAQAKHRKLQKKRASAPPAPSSIPSASSTLAPTTPVKQRPKRVSALSIFGKSAPLTLPLTPPASPTKPQVVVTAPSAPAAEAPGPRTRFPSLFGSKTLRTTARAGERTNAKLWPVTGSEADAVGATDASDPMGPAAMGMGWGRASSLSLTLMMGSGSAARTSRRLRKAPRARADMACVSSPELHRTADVDDDDDDDVGSQYYPDTAHDGERDPVFDVVRALRRKSVMDGGGTVSNASTFSLASSGTLLFRPMRPKAPSVRSCSPSPSFVLRGAFV